MERASTHVGGPRGPAFALGPAGLASGAESVAGDPGGPQGQEFGRPAAGDLGPEGGRRPRQGRVGTGAGGGRAGARVGPSWAGGRGPRWAGGRAGGRASPLVPAPPRLTGGDSGCGGGGSRSRLESGPRCGTRVGIGARPGAAGAGSEEPAGDRAAPPRRGRGGRAGPWGCGRGARHGPAAGRSLGRCGAQAGTGRRASTPGHAGSILGTLSAAVRAPRAGSGPNSWRLGPRLSGTVDRGTWGLCLAGWSEHANEKS